MKNYLSGEYFDLTKKLLLKMRMTFLSLMITASSLFASNVNSQDAKISLNLHDKSLFEVIDLIEKQTEYLFVYDKNDIDIDTKISVIANNLSVADVLSNILKRTDVIFAKVGTNIILLPKDNISVLQGSKVKGNVVDASTNEPIVGANIVIEGSTIGTITDINGRFSLDIPTTEAVIIASFIGYNTEKIIYTGQNSVEIRLIPDITKLEEIVVIGYGIAKRKDITGSISSVSSEKLKETPAISLNQAMQGKTAGVQVNLGDNAPGGGVSVSIRGVGSITQASDPIYVVDGVIMEGTLNHINVNDIESIDILKDASAAAIYGSRAANGVVLVTTKRGKEGTSNVSFLMRTSVQSVDNLPEMLTAQELANIRIEGNVNAQLDNLWRNNPSMTIGEYSTQFNKLKKEYMAQLPQTMFSETERNTLLAGESYNWLDEITQTGLVQDYTVAFSSGNEKSNYYISANYYNHKGLIIGSEHKRINLRINMEHQLKEWLKIGVNSNFTHGKTESIGESVVNGLGMNPMYPFFIDGVRPLSVPFYTSAGLNNPVLSQKIDNDFTSRRYSINTYLIVNFTKDLFLKSNIVADVKQ
ncbi:MAG: SusC/RagA family TonB-linked outer membrane protein [Bacteroidales bacterium]|nr:SusC/RagA family TonB-linked outer membrane protein [Bacteroidales bacterium]